MFEKDAHRASVMHRHRVKLFANVEGDALNRQHFDGLVKSIALETSQACRQIHVIKAGNDWPAAKVNAANCEACERISKFLQLFYVDGTLPEKIEDTWEPHVLPACTTLARLLLQQHVRLNRCAQDW